MATIKDIAEKAGVSMMTVSRAFNNPKIVKDEVRVKILAIAKELNYLPNQAARSLASKKSGMIQIITRMNPDDFYFTQLFTGAAHYLSDHGYSMMISKGKTREYQYDGAVFMGLSAGEDQLIYHTIKKPYVLLGKTDLPIDWVDIDNTDGSYKMTKYLIDSGHKKIGLIGINHDEAFTQERYLGYVKAMNAAGLTIPKEAVFRVPHSIEGGRRISPIALAKKDITAYVCESDLLAYVLIDYAKEQGMSIPEQLSVVGFDGFLFNKMSIPHITTVKQPVYRVGVEIARVLVNRINEQDRPKQRVLIKTEFENGGSVKVIN